MSSDREFTRRMLQTVATVAVVAVVLATLYAARAALMLIYISALIAMGFSPLVSLIQHPSHGHIRFSRTFASGTPSSPLSSRSPKPARFSVNH